MDLARGRRRFFRAYARNQGRLYPTDCTASGTDGRDFAATRKRHLATAISEHTIRDDRDYATHMDYIHFNPVKHGLVKEARDWEFSSFQRCVTAGLYPPEWVGTEGDAIYAGERV